MSEVLLEESAWGIARLTLNRPEHRNALSADLVGSLIGAFRRLRDDSSIRVIEVTGAGNKVFCAGGDLSGGALGGGEGPLSGHHDRAHFGTLLRAMREVGKPIIGTVQGHALGGGFGLAMSCDMVIAAEEACFGTPEIKVGLFPMVIMSVLVRNVPQKKLMEMMFLGERVSAVDALTFGFVNRVVPRVKLREAADVWLQKLAGASPAILKLGRDAFYRMSELPFDAALDYLNAQLTLNLMTEDAMEGVAAFIQKRPPEWKGR